jgi:diguanylate cyclase (GGDEF)-like protein
VATQPVDPEGFLTGVKYLYEHKQETSRDEIALHDGRTFDRYSAPMFGGDGRYYGRVWYFRDITERKQMEEKLKYLAYYDALTGLPNRNLFLERINQEIARAKVSSGSLAVVITDINKFKSIYDIYGSEVGDRVLKEVAERLSTAIGKGDIAAHLGNDEFGIALMNIRDDDIIMLEKIIKTASYPLRIDRDELILTFSTGISLYPHNGENASELLKAAGLALSIAKKEGRNSSQFYMKDMNTTASELMLLEKQLVTAIKNEEFILHYQPYWDITTKKMVGMEALVRWRSQDKGLVPPGKFIPVLEDTGMIIEVGEWILREATRQVKEWQDNGYPVVPVSVNMSLVQFRQKNLVEMVKRVMGECGFYPSLLTLEITESAFMQDIEFTRSVLAAMKEIGCSISIDDFGTGYSSLAYLKRLPIDNLKIDISFIREMAKDPDSTSIVTAIIGMAHTLNMKTIAEGVETEEQWKILRLLRCDLVQGFYFSKPLPAEDVEDVYMRTL